MYGRPPYDGVPGTALSAVTDGVMLWVAFACAQVVAPGGAGTTDLALLGAMALVTVVGLGRRGLYGARPARLSLLDVSSETAGSISVAVVLTLAAGAVAGVPGSSIELLLYAWAFAIAGVVAMRIALCLSCRRARARGVGGQRTLIVGAGAIGAQLEARLDERPQLGLTPVGYLDGDPPQGTMRRRAVLGALPDLERVVAEEGVEHVIVAFSSAPDSTVLPLLRRCEALGLEVAVVPRLFENVNARQWVEHVGGLPLIAMKTVDPRSWQYAAKHGLGRLISAGLLLAFAPVMAVVAVAVKLGSPGPVLFRQRRVGRDGQVFDILKFRSMREGDDGAAARITPVGAFLRRSSIDELPQLLNVLKGDMSLVGPRPERPEFVELFCDDHIRYGDRHRVKSGITGWAQVHGLRGQTSLADRVEWDNWYIQNWSLWLDFKIMLLTPLEVLRSRAEKHVGESTLPVAASAPWTDTTERAA